MLLSKTVITKWNPFTKKWYEEKGYNFTAFGDAFEVNIEDLSYGSGIIVKVKCDKCRKILNVKWLDYVKDVKQEDKYYCLKCVHNLFAGDNIAKAKLNKSKSFEQWCIDNNKLDILGLWDFDLNDRKPNEVCYAARKKYFFKCPRGIHNSELKKLSDITINGVSVIHCTKCDSLEQWCIDTNRTDVLDRWDYELNKYKPNEISQGSHHKYYFKCPKGIHKSELKEIRSFTQVRGYSDCNQCNSFAQWGIDSICEDFLKKYWDYEKNKNINPWEISYGSQKKVWIKCQEKDYHGSYETTCDRFTTQQRRCPYCCKSKIHPKDSLGQYIIDNYGEDFLSKIWSNKNKKSSFQYSPQANQKVWWKCLDGKHDDYARNIDSSTRYNYRCPSCTIFKGEIKIEDWLIKNHIIFKSQKTFKKCKYKQVLQFDFYLAQHNLLIEYQGEQHEKPIDFAGKGEEWANKLFQVNKTKDEIKKQFAISSNISLLEIWYWDYNNIEEILDNIIIKKNYNNKYFMRNKTKTA